MRRWLISVPVWGERYVEEFCATALPALNRAVRALTWYEIAKHDGADVRLVIHTDQPDRVRGATSFELDLRPVPAGLREFDCMSQAHREVLSLGLRGDIVVLLTAGAVISERGLVYCAETMENQRLMAVLCAVPRVLAAGPLPDPKDADVLMEWAWDNRHPMTRECTWPEGRSTDLSRTFFVGRAGVTTRQCLPHPLAVRIDGRPLRFTPTVDANLMRCFAPIEMHVAPNCRDLALIKLSPADKGFETTQRTMAQRAARGELIIADPLQRWAVGHSILLVGHSRDGCEDGRFADAITGGN